MSEIQTETVVRVHTSEGAIEVGTCPDNPNAVQIRVPDARSREYYGDLRLTLEAGSRADNKAFALAISDAIRKIALTLPD